MNIPYFDTHCDTASGILGKYSLRSNPLHVDLERGMAFNPRAQVFAFYADGGNYTNYRAQYDNFKAEIEKNSDIVSLCRNGADATKAIDEGKTAAFISVEGAELLECSIEKLEKAYEEGVRIVTITWNHANLLSGSNAEKTEQGLTENGVAFLKRCNELGIFPDISHLSDAGFWDVIRLSEKPVIATHSNSRNLWNHPRNLTDDMFKALIETGGIVGINLYGLFLSDEPCIDTVIKHIEHFLELGGAKHLAIGADLDGCDILPREISAVQDMNLLYEAIEKNFGEKIAKDIYFNNAMTLFNTI